MTTSRTASNPTDGSTVRETHPHIHLSNCAGNEPDLRGAPGLERPGFVRGSFFFVTTTCSTMTNFSLIFGLALLANVGVTLQTSDTFQRWRRGSVEVEAPSEKQKQWLGLLRRYLAVYLLAALSDWFQGPYVYALYADYGYSQHDIAILFVAGFGSSMIFGSFVGGMADWGGRKTFVLIFAVTYALSCLTKHFKNFWILMIGRLLGGVATSLLFSVFDAWMIRAHADAGVKNYLGKSFTAASYGNYLVAIASGIIANKAADLAPMKPLTMGSAMYFGGYLAPFDLALLCLLACGVLCFFLWTNNFGEADEQSDSGRNAQWYDGLRSAALTTFRSQDILLCGAIASLFEGSMYIFVFMWTPALSNLTSDPLPFGVIFSTFMVCCMAGSSSFGLLEKKYKSEQIAMGVFSLGALSMFMASACRNMTLKFLCMNIFEVAVGLYWPAMGTMKGAIVPESKRAAIYNLFRIPLNLIVLLSLLTDPPPSLAFFLNSLMLSVATIAQFILMKRREKNGQMESTDTDEEALLPSPVKEDAAV